MYQLTDVVKKLLIANIVIFFAAQIIMGDGRAMYFHSPFGDSFRPLQIVTHMFMHGGTQHLIFNMIGLYFFGPRIEMVWGPKKFLLYYLASGLGALAIYVVLQTFVFGNTGYPVVGASGAITAVLVAFAYLFPKEEIQMIFPPIRMKAVVMVALFLGLDFFLGVSRAATGVAHFAHIGGAVTGFLFLTYWKSKHQLYK